MLKMMRWGLGVVGLAAAGAIAVAAIGVGGSASAQVGPDDEDQPRGERYRELLAEELGISIEELTTAQTSARDKLIDEKLAAGDITQEQADRLKEMELGEGRFGFGGHGFGQRLHTAVVSVFETAADVVGLDVTVLRERIADGESLVEIAASEDIDEATLKSDLVAALTDKINQAVTDGDIDQDKADMLLENLDEMVERAINAERPMEGRFGNGAGFRFHMERN